MAKRKENSNDAWVVVEIEEFCWALIISSFNKGILKNYFKYIIGIQFRL